VTCQTISLTFFGPADGCHPLPARADPAGTTALAAERSAWARDHRRVLCTDGRTADGASMNPARSFGPTAVGEVWDRHWLYWLAPSTAMMVAARTYDLLRIAGPPATQLRPPRVGLQGPDTERGAAEL